MTTRYAPPSPPFIGARHKGGRQTPKAIVLHGTVSSDDRGTARNIAEWWAGPTSPMSSAHYTVDPGETIQSVGDHTVAYHCGYNQDSIGIEFCDEQKGPASRWDDKDSRAILRRAARLAAQLALAYDIEVKHTSVAALKKHGPHGFYSHNDSRLAFGGTTHTDPRDFPWARFLTLVRAFVEQIKAENAVATRRKRFKILHAPLHGASTTNDEMTAALERPGVVSVAFSEAYQHGRFLKSRLGWRCTTGSGTKRDPATGRLVERDVAILVKRRRRKVASGVKFASSASTPIRIAPERYLAYSVDMLHRKPLAHISIHPHAVVRDQKDWDSDRGQKYRASMRALRRTVRELRKAYGEDLDIVITGDLQYRKGDPVRDDSPRDVFRDLDFNWVATGIDWMAFSEGLRLVNTVIVPTEINGQDHPWIEGTFERI